MTQVLRKLAEVVEKIKQEDNKIQAGNQQRIHFVRQRKPAGNTNQWRIEVDLGRQLLFPREICSLTLRPDMVLWTAVRKSALLVKLTAPWEGGLESAYERNRAKYEELVTECRDDGWSEALPSGGGS